MDFSECPKCGAPPLETNLQRCSYCGVTFNVKTVASVFSLSLDDVKKFSTALKSKIENNDSDIEARVGSLLCHLRMQNYSLANLLAAKLVSDYPELAESYYLISLSIIAGRKAKSLKLNEVRDIESKLNNAISLSEKQEYWFLLACIKYGYYRCNGLRVPSPTDEEIIENCYLRGINTSEVKAITTLLGINNAQFNNFFLE